MTHLLIALLISGVVVSALTALAQRGRRTSRAEVIKHNRRDIGRAAMPPGRPARRGRWRGQ